MFRIFRTIRKKLMEHSSNGRTGKKVRAYLLYAIGEILLVVIGILIALQINNWNEETKTKRDIDSALIEVMQDLESDIQVLSDEIVKREDDLEAQLRVIRFLESGRQMYDSLYADLGHVLLKRNTGFLSNGYDLLNDIGISKLKNRQLRGQLVDYYEVSITDVIDEIEDDKFEFEDVWLPYVRNNFREWKFGKYAYPNNDEELFNDSYFLASLKINLNNIKGTLLSHRQALIQAKELVALIRENRN